MFYGSFLLQFNSDSLKKSHVNPLDLFRDTTQMAEEAHVAPLVRKELGLTGRLHPR